MVFMNNFLNNPKIKILRLDLLKKSIFVFLVVKIKDSKNKQVDNSSIIIFSDMFFIFKTE